MLDALDTARKEQVRRMAELLDNYESPVRRGANKDLLDKVNDETLFLPRAASSPKLLDSDTSVTIGEKQQHPVSIRHSASPAQTTSQTPSWQKHSMRPSSPHAVTQVYESSQLGQPSTSDAYRLGDSLEIPCEVTGPKTHSRAAHISHVEDSYWANRIGKEQIHQSDITPSPVRYQQQFYTAQQFGPVVDESLLVESLRIASPRLPNSPSVRTSASVTSLTSSKRNQSRREMNHPDMAEQTFVAPETSITPNQLHKDERIESTSRHELDRSVSPVMSELSRVNSQATSLQRAISSALHEGVQSLRLPVEQSPEHLPLDFAIAAKYRKARSDRSLNTTMARFATSRVGPTIELQPVEAEAPPIEPVKQASPLTERVTSLAQASTSHENSVSNPQREETIQSPVARMKEQPRAMPPVEPVLAELPTVADLLITLERITEECSRRGHLIEVIAENLHTEHQAMTQQVESLTALDQFRQQDEKVLEYQEQVLELQAKVQTLLSQAENARLERTKASETAVRNSRSPSQALFHSEPSLAKSPVLQAPTPLRSGISLKPSLDEESFQEKILRWGQDVHIRPAEVELPGTPMNVVRKAEEMLLNTPAILSGFSLNARQSSPGNETIGFAEQVRQNSLPMPKQHVAAPPLAKRLVVDGRGGHMSLDQEARTTSTDIDQTYLLGALKRAEQEIARLKQAKTVSLPHEESSPVRPLTADMMPDARDTNIRQEEKLYTRLQLSDIDRLGPNELGNLLKNVLIQLDVPLAKLPVTITSLGASASVSHDHVHQILVEEALKLREFAESVHATIYGGDHIEGAVTSRQCLLDMHGRISKLQRAYDRKRSGRSSEHRS